jgi:hypothetical protein
VALKTEKKVTAPLPIEVVEEKLIESQSLAAEEII